MDELQGFPYSPSSIQKLCVILLFKLSKNIYIHKAGIPDSEKARPSKELSRLGPGLPWPRLSCRSWSLTLAAETHDRVWTVAADRRGEARSTSLCFLLRPHTSSNGGAPGRTFLPSDNQKNLSSGKTLASPSVSSPASREPLQTASASSNSGQ